MRTHGTLHEYKVHGCRCDPCREANMHWQREFRARPGKAQARVKYNHVYWQRSEVKERRNERRRKLRKQEREVAASATTS